MLAANWVFGARRRVSEHPGFGFLVILDITVQLSPLKAFILLGGNLLSYFIKRHFIPAEEYSTVLQKKRGPIQRNSLLPEM